MLSFAKCKCERHKVGESKMAVLVKFYGPDSQKFLSQTSLRLKIFLRKT